MGSRALRHELKHTPTTTAFVFAEEVIIRPGEDLVLRA